MSILDKLFDKADLRCTVCDAPMGTCDCWQKCDCGWSYQKGRACRNPIHGGEAAPMEATHTGRLNLP